MFYLRYDPQLVPEIERLRALPDAALHDIITLPRAHDDVKAVFNILTTNRAYLQVVLERTKGSTFLCDMLKWVMPHFANQPHELTQLWAVWWLVQPKNETTLWHAHESMAVLGLTHPPTATPDPYEGDTHQRFVASHVAGYWIVNRPDLTETILAPFHGSELDDVLFTAANVFAERGQYESALSLALRIETEACRFAAFLKLAPALPMPTRLPLLHEIQHDTQQQKYIRIGWLGNVIPLLPEAEVEQAWQEVLTIARSDESVDMQICDMGRLVVAVKADSARAQQGLAEMLQLIGDQALSDHALSAVMLALAVQDHPDAMAYYRRWYEQAIVAADIRERIRRVGWAASEFARHGLIQLAVSTIAAIGPHHVHTWIDYSAIVEAMVRQGQLDEAIAYADSLGELSPRDQMVCQIALTLGEQNDPRAHDIFEIAYDSNSMSFYGEARQQLGLWLARQHRLELAEQLAHEPFFSGDSLPEDYMTALHQQSVTIALAQDDIPSALAAARLLAYGKSYREESLCAIAAHAAERSGLAAAEAIIRELRPEAFHNTAWQGVGVGLARRGEMDEAIKIADDLRREANAKLTEMQSSWTETQQRSWKATYTLFLEDYPAAIDVAIAVALIERDQIDEALAVIRRLPYPEHRVAALHAMLLALPASHRRLNWVILVTLKHILQIEGRRNLRKASLQILLVMLAKDRRDQAIDLFKTLDDHQRDFAIPFLQVLAPEMVRYLTPSDEKYSQEFIEVIEDWINRGQTDTLLQMLPLIQQRITPGDKVMYRLAEVFAKDGHWALAFATIEPTITKGKLGLPYQLADYLATIARWDMPPATMLAVLRIIGWGRLRWQRIYELVAEAGLT